MEGGVGKNTLRPIWQDARRSAADSRLWQQPWSHVPKWQEWHEKWSDQLVWELSSAGVNGLSNIILRFMVTFGPYYHKLLRDCIIWIIRDNLIDLWSFNGMLNALSSLTSLAAFMKARDQTVLWPEINTHPSMLKRWKAYRVAALRWFLSSYNSTNLWKINGPHCVTTVQKTV